MLKFTCHRRSGMIFEDQTVSVFMVNIATSEPLKRVTGLVGFLELRNNLVEARKNF
jgi:hypothetical protein